MAGTNGKGSTAHLLASIYQAAGYRVGLYTSPHLRSFTERIRVNGVCIPQTEVVAFVAQQRATIEQIEPSFFEVTVAMAFAYFARQAVDIAIIEVGLGGRLDSTNIITPLLSVITTIGWDHMDLLGDTLPLIARQKAGIIKAGIPVVLGEPTAETLPVFLAVAGQNSAPVYRADQAWELVDLGLFAGARRIQCTPVGVAGFSPFVVELPLPGLYQLANLRTVLTAVGVLLAQLPVQAADIAAGCAQVITATGLRGRFEVLGTSPMVVADTAHNEPGLLAVLATLQTVPHRRLRLVLGFVRDKAADRLVRLFPVEAAYYFCQADSPRALPVAELVGLARLADRPGNGYADVNAALTAAKREADPADLILVTGSTYVVGEVTEC